MSEQRSTDEQLNLPTVMRVWASWCQIQGIKEEVQIALSAGADEIERIRGIIDRHNKELREMCGIGDQEGVACKYRQYFPRRCPECPKRNWSIEI